MSLYLIDTNILSELFRKKPNKLVVHWLENLTELHLSTIVIEEIIYGLSSIKANNHLNWFKELLKSRIIIYPVDLNIAEKAGELRGDFRSKGIQRSQADLLIAATAFCHQLTLATRNEKDFLNCQISVYNPY